MPIYAYRCGNCGFQKDVLQKMSEAALTVCPSCGAASFAKQLSAPAFQLKGTGWYVTDFRENGKKADKEGDATPGGVPEKSGDAKPDAGKSDGAKADGGKAEGGKAEGGKPDTAKSDAGKSDVKAPSKSEAGKSESSRGSAAGGSGSSPAPKTAAPPASGGGPGAG